MPTHCDGDTNKMDERVVWGLRVMAALGCGLTAGTFFAFSSFVMPALGRLPPAQGVAAMQSVNVAVLTPSFMSVFLGTAVLYLALGIPAVKHWDAPGARLVLAGALLYVVGTVGVTMAFNVPLNDALAKAAPSAPESATLWKSYLADWTTWNTLRAALALAASVCFIVALCQRAPPLTAH